MCCAALSMLCTCCSCCASGAHCCSRVGGKGGCAKQTYWAIMLITMLVTIGLYFGFAEIPAQVTFYSYNTCYLNQTTSSACQVQATSLYDPRTWYQSSDMCDSLRKDCVRNYTVYRFSFSLAVFFLVVCLGSICSGAWHRGWWVIKTVGFVALIALSFFTPNEFFAGYEQFARVASILFLVLQIVILIDFCYDLSEYIMDKADNPDQYPSRCGPVFWKALYLTLSAAAGIAALVGLILLFVYFRDRSDGAGPCSENLAIFCVTLILGVLSTAVSVCAPGVEGGLLTPMVVWAYAVYMSYQAASSQVNACNPISTGEDPGSVATSLIIASLALTWTTARTTNSAPNLFKRGGTAEGGDAPAAAAPTRRKKGQKDDGKGMELSHQTSQEEDVHVAVVPDGEGDAGKKKTKKDEEEDEEEEPRGKNGAWFFHLVMCLGAVYMAMLITRWRHYDPNLSPSDVDTEYKVSFWVKATSQWVTYIIYFWTLLAPLCCPSRDFGDNYNSLRHY